MRAQRSTRIECVGRPRSRRRWWSRCSRRRWTRRGRGAGRRRPAGGAPRWRSWWPCGTPTSSRSRGGGRSDGSRLGWESTRTGVRRGARIGGGSGSTPISVALSGARTPGAPARRRARACRIGLRVGSESAPGRNRAGSGSPGSCGAAPAIPLRRPRERPSAGPEAGGAPPGRAGALRQLGGGRGAVRRAGAGARRRPAARAAQPGVLPPIPRPTPTLDTAQIAPHPTNAARAAQPGVPIPTPPRSRP